jgi:hypothetical protein
VARYKQSKGTSGAPNPPDLRLNFLPVTLSTARFSGGVLPYESAEQLAELRKAYPDSHVVVRRGQEVVCVPLASGVASIGDERIFEVADSASIVRKLLERGLIRFVIGRGYLLSDFDPATFVVRQSQRDLLARAMPDSPGQRVDWLHVYPKYALGARVLYPQNRAPVFGVQVHVSTQRDIALSVMQLIERGLDVHGRYVLARQPEDSPNPLRDPISRRRLAGRVAQVIGSQIVLDDSRDVTEVPVDQSWLEASLENFEACIHLAGASDVDSILRRLAEAVFNVVGGQGRYEELQRTARLLGEQPIPLAANLVCAAGQPLGPRPGADAGTYRRFQRPTFVFDPAGSKTDTWHNRGLQMHGPFDAESFLVKRPDVVVVTPGTYRGDVEVFLRKLRDGIPQNQVYGQGFVRKYHLNDCTFRFETFDVGTREATSYREACLRALQGAKPDLAVVVIEERYKQFVGDDDPYLVAKSVFLSQGVPVQEVEIETIRVPPELMGGTPYVLDNIALASYAKLGGIPFVMAATPGLAHELVIGIGSASLRPSRLARAERVVGITTVFSADGNYLLYNRSREVDIDDYPEELLTTLRRTVGDIQARNAWQPGDAVRLIFHVFKPLRDVEAQAVKSLIEQLTNFRVEFAFLHVSEDHGWMVFDLHEEGRQDWRPAERWQRGKVKGEFVPDRGYAVPLGRWQILLTVTGPGQLKTPLQGTPRPLLLVLHRESTFRDLSYLAGQVYRFTSLSWRSFLPGSRPVTILYSDRIASMLGKLRQVRNWNPDALGTQLQGSRWFL